MPSSPTTPTHKPPLVQPALVQPTTRTRFPPPFPPHSRSPTSISRPWVAHASHLDATHSLTHPHTPYRPRRGRWPAKLAEAHDKEIIQASRVNRRVQRLEATLREATVDLAVTGPSGEDGTLCSIASRVRCPQSQPRPTAPPPHRDGVRSAAAPSEAARGQHHGGALLLAL